MTALTSRRERVARAAIGARIASRWAAYVHVQCPSIEIRRIKQQPGRGLMLFGGADVVASFMRFDLIDDYRLVVHPVVLGGGTRVFGVDKRIDLDLVEARAFESGVVLLHYRRAVRTD